MIDAIGRANMDYMVRLAKDPEWTQAQLQSLNEFTAARGALYEGHPVPVPVKPHFISPQQRRLLQAGLSRLHSALERFINIWLEDEELQADWGVTPEEAQLYKVDPGFSTCIQIARFDAFLHDMDLKFLEFNCDSPGGTGYADIIHQAFLDFFDRNDLASAYNVSNRHRVLHLKEALTDAYNEWRANHPERPETPFVVIADWRDVASLPDIDITLRNLQEQNMPAVFADPRDMELRADGLYLDNHRVDLVYKRVIVKELVQDPDAQNLVEAYKRGHICMVNPPRSVIPGNKKILAALRRPDILAQLTPLQRKAVLDWVPWTEILRDDKVEFHGFRVNLYDFVLDNREKLVLKAAQGYGGKDVFLGFETEPEEWAALVDKHLHSNAWIVQELVHIPKELFPEVKDNQVHMNLMNVNINPLAFGGKYAGSYTRISKKNVINVSFGGGMTATMTLEPKEEEL